MPVDGAAIDRDAAMIREASPARIRRLTSHTGRAQRIGSGAVAGGHEHGRGSLPSPCGGVQPGQEPVHTMRAGHILQNPPSATASLAKQARSAEGWMLKQCEGFIRAIAAPVLRHRLTTL